jgi:hypothetical protein
MGSRVPEGGRAGLRRPPTQPAPPLIGSLPGKIFCTECGPTTLTRASNHGPNCRMRNRDPRDNPPAKRRPTPYRVPPVTMGHLRSHGCRRLLIYCSTGLCHHRATIEADRCRRRPRPRMGPERESNRCPTLRAIPRPKPRGSRELSLGRGRHRPTKADECCPLGL